MNLDKPAVMSVSGQMTGQGETGAGADKARVFISYSRKDAEVLGHMQPSLEARGYTVLLDRKDIAPAEVWRTRLDAMILQADAVVFVISPDSVASEVCRWEVERTLAYGKKLIPVLWRPTDPAACPPAIAERNWIAAPASDALEAFDEGVMQAVASALETDIDWERERSLWLGRATRWGQGEESPGLLLKAEEAAQAEAWAARRPAGAAELPDLLLAFFTRSRDQARAERDHLRSMSGRAFVQPIREALESFEPDRALRMMATACVLAEDPDFELVPELWRAGATALDDQPLRAVRDDTAPRDVEEDSDPPTLAVGVSPDGRWIALHTVCGDVRLCDENGQVVWSVRPPFEVRDLYLLRNGGVIVIGWAARVARLDAADGRVTGGADLATDLACGVWDRGAEALAVAREVEIVAYDAATDTVRIVAGLEQPAHLLAWNARAGVGVAVLESDEDGSTCVIFGPEHTTPVRFDQHVIAATIEREGRSVCIAAAWTLNVIDARTGDRRAEFGHGDKPNNLGDLVEALAFSRDGRRLLSGSFDGTSRLWNVETGEELARIDLGEAIVRPVVFSPDETEALAVGSDWTVRRWDVSSGREVQRIADRHMVEITQRDLLGVQSAGFTENGDLWLALRRNLVQVWPRRRFEVWDLDGFTDTPVRGGRLAASTAGRLFRLSDEGRLDTLSPTGVTASRRLSPHPRGAKALFVDETGDRIIVPGANGTTAWRLSDARVEWIAEHDEPTRETAYSPASGATLVCGGRSGSGVTGRVVLLDRDGAVIRTGETRGWISAVLWRAATRTFLVGTVEGGLQEWPDDGSEPVSRPALRSKIEAIDEDVEGRLFAPCDKHIWALDPGADDWRPVAPFGWGATALRVHPTLPLAVVGYLGSMDVVDLRRQAVLRHIPVTAGADWKMGEVCAYADRWVIDGWNRLLMLDGEGGLRVHDLADLAARVSDPASAIAAALANGNHGTRFSETVDLLMRDAPEDLVGRLRALRSV